MDYYKSFNTLYIEPDAVDIVSLDKIKPTGRNYIMYLRLVTKTISGVKHERVPTTLVPWDTLSAYDTFIVNNVKIDPGTRQTLNNGFCERLILYKSVIDTFGPDFEPRIEDIVDIFNRYMQDQDIKLTERMYLRAYLQIDDTDVIHEFDAQGKEIRDAVVKVLTEKGVGSWTLRKSSIKDSGLVKVKILSYLDTDGYADHIVLCHVIGLGYYSTNNVKREQHMPGIQDGEPNTSLPPFTTVFPCFIDLLEDIKKSKRIRFDKYCKK